MTHIGLIGQGLLPRVYARRCAAISDTEVTAVSGTDGIADDITQYVSGPVYNDTRELCKDDPDVVFVCSPPDPRSVVKTAADQGIDVFCHPPIDSTVEEANAIGDIARDAGIVFIPGHICRIAPEYVTAKERIDDSSGSVGNARTFRQLSTDHWIASRDRGRDVVYGLALHDIDFLRWTCGAVDRVFARQAIHNGDAYVLITLRFTDTVGHIDARLSKRSERPFVHRFELASDNGLIEFDSDESSPTITRAADGPSDGGLFAPMRPKDPYQLLVEHTLDYIVEDAEPIVSIGESIESLRVGRAVLASIEQGAPVAVDEISD